MQERQVYDSSTQDYFHSNTHTLSNQHQFKGISILNMAQ